VFNNGPEAPNGWDRKVTALMEEALFAVSVDKQRTIALRTQLPSSLQGSAVDPVQQLTYEGAFPVARLTAADSRLPVGFEVTLTAHGQFAVHDPDASAAPAVVFDLTFDNTNGSADVSMSGFFAMPNIIGAQSFEPRGGRVLVLSEGNASIHKDGGMAIALDADRPISWSWASVAGGVPALLRAFAAGAELSNTSQTAPTAGAVQASVDVPKGQAVVLTAVLSWYFPHHIWAGEFPTDIGNYYTNLFASAEGVALSVAANKSQSLQSALNFHQTFLDTDLPAYLQDALINSAGVFYKTSMWLADGKFRMYESHSCDDLQPPHLHFYRAQALQTLFPTLERQIPVLYGKLQVKRDNESFPGGVVHVGDLNYTQAGPHGNCSCGVPKGYETFWEHSVNLTGDQACFYCMEGAIFNSIAHPGTCASPGCITTDRTELVSANRVDNVFDFMLDVTMNARWSTDGSAWATSMWPSVKRAISWLVRSSARYGLPHNRLNTFDEHGVVGTVNAYNSFAYLGALGAGMQLAKDAGDAEAAAAAESAYKRGEAAMMKLLWQPGADGGFFTSFWCAAVCHWVNSSTADDCTNTTGIFAASNHALQSSVLYGANWLWLLGIGDSLRSLSASIASHLRVELARNLNPAGGGLKYTTNRTTGYHCDDKLIDGDGRFTDHDLWAMANPTHTAAALWTRAHPAVVADAMKPTEAMVTLYSQTLATQWDYHDVGCPRRDWDPRNFRGGQETVTVANPCED
jgi:uncharacterized protein (DUF608 family)